MIKPTMPMMSKIIIIHFEKGFWVLRAQIETIKIKAKTIIPKISKNSGRNTIKRDTRIELAS
jgi:hypothetical protein